jgi:hypothetical protein
VTDYERARQLAEEGHTLLPADDPEQGFLAVHLVDGEESSEIVRLSFEELQRLREEFDNLHPQTG